MDAGQQGVEGAATGGSAAPGLPRLPGTRGCSRGGGAGTAHRAAYKHERAEFGFTREFHDFVA